MKNVPKVYYKSVEHGIFQIVKEKGRTIPDKK